MQMSWKNVTKLRCPKCRSVRLTHDGIVRRKQRYLCQHCGMHTIKPKGGKGK